MEIIYRCDDTENHTYYNLEEIKFIVSGSSCDVTSSGPGLNFLFYKCQFKLDVFKSVTDMLANHTMSCFSIIKDYLTDKKSYVSTIGFIDSENNTSIGWEGLKYITESFYSVVAKLSTVSSSSVKFRLNFHNAGILAESASQLFESSKCQSSIGVFYDSKGLLGWAQEKDAILNYLVNSGIYDSNKFFTIVRSEGTNDSECIFNQPSYSSLLPTTSFSSTESLNTTSINPIALLGLTVGSFCGLYMLGKYVYAKCFTSTQTECSTPEEIISETTYLGECTEIDL